MSHYLLAAPDRQSAGFHVTRLLLSTGRFNDTLTFDLVSNFEDPVKASTLCSRAAALRGLPSESEEFGDRETNFLPDLPRRVANPDELRALAETIHADGVFLHDGTEWLRLVGDEGIERLRDYKHFRYEAPKADPKQNN